MATRQAQRLARLALAPSIGALSILAFVPLALVFYFAFLRYNLQDPENLRWFGWNNFYYFLKDPYFVKNLVNTLLLVGGVIVTTVVGGIGLALLFDQPFWGRGIARVLMISPFFILPTVSSMVWKNLIMHPQFGLFAEIQSWFGAIQPFRWFEQAPLFSVGLIVAWQWLPFSALILLTALQSLDSEQKDAAVHGRGKVLELLLAYHPAASGAPDHCRGADPDHFHHEHVCGNQGDVGGRLCGQPDLSRVLAAAE